MKRIGEFFACLFFNMLLSFKWTVPAWTLLAMHFIFSWPIIWFFIALSLWVVGIILWMSIMGWAVSCSKPDKPKENKNPYSVGTKAREETKKML